jgi:hypothetical protein
MTDLNVGDIVTVRGSDIAGEVIEVGSVGCKVCVRRPNPMSPGTRMTHWVKVGKVTLVRMADDGERDSMAESK